MKIKLPSIPFWARPPSYRRNIARRLQPSDTIWTSPINRDLQARAERDAYRRADFTTGPCYLPDDDHPRLRRRWRWWVDPIVIGMALAFFAIGAALLVLAGA
jgi:hypothetical protein